MVYSDILLFALLLVPALGQIIVNPNCDFYQTLALGQTYYIYNVEYYHYYPPNTRCRWTALTPVGYRIQLNCKDIFIPMSPNCGIERMAISLTGNPNFLDGKNYCGNSTSQIFTSIKTHMSIGLFAEAQAQGGRMYCDIYAIVDTTPPIIIPDSPVCDCGVKQQRRRIVGGTETGINEYPFMAGVINLSLKTLFCGATIIHHHYAISAAHCFDRITDPNTVALLVGDHDYTSGVETNTSALYPLMSIKNHELYNIITKENDIAILRTQLDMTFSAAVGVVCLPFQWTDAIPPAGANVTVLGWGTTEFTGPLSKVLLGAVLLVVTNTNCSEEYKNTDKKIFPTNLCTFAPGKDACQGDSGSPVLHLRNVPQQGIRVFLAGVISFGIGCNIDYPGVNTRISQFMRWIVLKTLDAIYCVKPL